MHEGGGRWVGSNKLVELKKKRKAGRNRGGGEGGRVRVPISRCVDKKSGVPEEERGVWGFQRG